jgi:hypothetical protein
VGGGAAARLLANSVDSSLKDTGLQSRPQDHEEDGGSGLTSQDARAASDTSGGALLGDINVQCRLLLESTLFKPQYYATSVADVRTATSALQNKDGTKEKMSPQQQQLPAVRLLRLFPPIPPGAPPNFNPMRAWELLGPITTAAAITQKFSATAAAGTTVGTAAAAAGTQAFSGRAQRSSGKDVAGSLAERGTRSWLPTEYGPELIKFNRLVEAQRIQAMLPYCPKCTSDCEDENGKHGHSMLHTLNRSYKHSAIKR